MLTLAPDGNGLQFLSFFYTTIERKDMLQTKQRRENITGKGGRRKCQMPPFCNKGQRASPRKLCTNGRAKEVMKDIHR